MAALKSERKNFLALGESDYKILIMLIRRSAEFSKLNSADQQVFVWYLIYSPIRLKSWIDHLSESYSKSASSFNGIRLIEEIKDLIFES